MSEPTNGTISHHTPAVSVASKFCAEIYVADDGEWEFDGFYGSEEELSGARKILDAGNERYVVVRFTLPEIANV